MELVSAGMTASQAPANYFEEPVKIYSKGGSLSFEGFVQRFSGYEGEEGCSHGDPLRLRGADGGMYWVPRELELALKHEQKGHIYRES